jgi:hypothetical protein
LLLAQLAHQLESAFAAQVNVDERDVWPKLGDLTTRFGHGPGAPDHLEPLFQQQTAHFPSEARVVIDDQAAQPHVGMTMARTAGPRHCS